MSNYPPGVNESDFYEDSDYGEYVADCLADGDIPCSKWQWEQWQDEPEDVEE